MSGTSLVPFTGKGGHDGLGLGMGLGLGSPFAQGLLVGAAVTFLLTNENVQKALFRGVARVIGTVQGGIEEMKERYHDAEAELHTPGEEAAEAEGPR